MVHTYIHTYILFLGPKAWLSSHSPANLHFPRIHILGDSQEVKVQPYVPCPEEDSGRGEEALVGPSAVQLARERKEVVCEDEVRGVNTRAMVTIEKGRELKWRRGRVEMEEREG